MPNACSAVNNCWTEEHISGAPTADIPRVTMKHTEQERILKYADSFWKFGRIFEEDAARREAEEEIQRIEAGEQYKRELRVAARYAR